MFTRFDPSALGAYVAVRAVQAGPAGAADSRELKLSPFHYMASATDPTGACAQLAAAHAGGAAADASLQAAWTAAAQVGSRAGGHGL